MKAKVMTAVLAVSLCAVTSWAANPRPIAEVDGDGTLSFESGTGGGGARAVGDLVNFDAALQSGASYLRGMQADITEDNAGNGTNGVNETPDDPDDGGWDWRVTSPPAPFFHTTSASPTNLYGATALGLYYAYLESPAPGNFTALQDAADHAVAVGPSVIRTASDVKFLMLFNDLYSSVVAPTTVYNDAAKAKYDGRIVAYGGSATALAEFIRDVRGVTQGYPNGIIGWDVGKYAVIAQMLFDRYGSPYDADADAIAEVLWQDSFNGNPGLFDIVADAGWDATYANVNFYWYTLGVTGLIDAFSASGSHIAEVSGLVTRLLDSQFTGGAISFSYGANAFDEDWQSTAYAMNSLGLLDQATYQLQINWMGYWTGATQDGPSGGWVYGSGNHYPEVVGECARGLFFTSNTLTYALVDDDFTSQADVDAYNAVHGTSHVWGYDAFATIQNGVDAVNGSTVQVEPGIYTEQVYIDKSLDLVGAGAGLTILQAVPPASRVSYNVTQWTGSVRSIDACIGVNAAGTVNISGFTVDGLDLGPNNFYGIHYFDTSGSVNHCTVTNIRNPASPGAQRVASIVATHGVGVTITTDISNNTVPNFQKGGIVIMGPGVTFTVNNNTVSGVLSSAIAGNCIQLSYGASGSTLNNVVDGTAYTGTDWASTGILLFESGDVTMVGDEVSGCESGVNFSDWGWVYAHPTAVNLSFTGLNLHNNDWPFGAQLSRDNSDPNITLTDSDVVNNTYDGIDIWGSGPDPWGGSYYTGWNNGDLNVSISGCRVGSSGYDGIWTADLSGNATNIVHSFSVYDTSFNANTGSAVNNTFPSATVDASGCWWGDATGPIQAAAAGRSQRPAAPRTNPFGDALPATGTTTTTGSNLLLVGETIYGSVDYTPWMANVGTNNLPGFAGDFSTLWVDDDSPQTGATVRIQEGVDMVTASTVIVAAGTYGGNLIVPAGVLLQSNGGAPTTMINGAGGCAVTINGDGVTIDGFTITNPTGSSGICSVDHSAIGIRNNIVSNVGDVGGTTNVHAIVIVSSSAAVAGVTIEDNQLSAIRVGPNKSNSAISVGWSSGSELITGLIIQRNAISDVVANTGAWPVGHGAYGILINHGTGVTGKTVAPQVLNNTITALEGLWAHGIGLEGNTPDALVTGNAISNVLDHKTPPDAVAVQVEDNAGALSVAINFNCFTNVALGVQNVTAMLVDAENNWWGGVSGPGPVGPGSGAGVTADVDYDPWVAASPCEQACGNGILDSEEDCDDGNLRDGDCCSAICIFEVSSAPCDLDGDLCTIDECDGFGACGATGNDVVCQNPVPPCEAGEVCNSTTGACDALPDASAGVACGSDGNECTSDECDGNGSCAHPANGLCGACCLADLTCRDDVLDATCVSLGGVFHAASVPCGADSDGDGVVDHCDSCAGVDDYVYGPCDQNTIPTVSQWGLVVMALLLLTAGKVYFGRRQRGRYPV